MDFQNDEIKKNKKEGGVNPRMDRDGRVSVRRRHDRVSRTKEQNTYVGKTYEN